MNQGNEPVRVPVRLYKTDELVTIAAPMPGLSHDDVTITVRDDRHVVLEGRLCGDDDPVCGSLKGLKEVLLDEWDPGHYEREVELPTAVDGSRGRVSYGNGIVVVVLPIAAEMRAGRLTVTNPADKVDEASEASFPASDPPAWTGTTVRPLARP